MYFFLSMEFPFFNNTFVDILTLFVYNFQVCFTFSLFFLSFLWEYLKQLFYSLFLVRMMSILPQSRYLEIYYFLWIGYVFSVSLYAVLFLLQIEPLKKWPSFSVFVDWLYAKAVLCWLAGYALNLRINSKQKLKQSLLWSILRMCFTWAYP